MLRCWRPQPVGGQTTQDCHRTSEQSKTIIARPSKAKHPKAWDLFLKGKNSGNTRQELPDGIRLRFAE